MQSFWVFNSVLSLLVGLVVATDAAGSPFASKLGAHEAQEYGRSHPVVEAAPGGAIFAETEQFQIEAGDWQALRWGDNYYCATMANTFLSRKAFLGTPEQCAHSVASAKMRIETTGRYLVLVRYEAVYRFETQFRVRIYQGGKTVFDRLYGARRNVKIWAFGKKLQAEVAWPWGAVENLVWEGHDAIAQLSAGEATITLIAQRQPDPAARRNVDLVMLTTDVEDVRWRIANERYLPLDGLLTQSGDLYLKLHNHLDGAAMTLQIPRGQEHSPYWVHHRTAQPKSLSAQPGQTTEWIEVGSLLDTLNDGQWTLEASPLDGSTDNLHYTLEFGVPGADGKVESIEKLMPKSTSWLLDYYSFTSEKPTVTYFADTRYVRRVGLPEHTVKTILDQLDQQQPHGRMPQQTVIFARVPTQIAARLGTTFGVKGLREVAVPNGYLDVRSLNDGQLEDRLRGLREAGLAANMATISLGDEIGLADPPVDANEGFREWLREQHLTPAEVDPSAGNDWKKIHYDGDAALAQTEPRRFYWCQLYRQDYGIESQKRRSDLVRRYLPHAGVGANYSPHHGRHYYLGDVHKWITLFRRDGMTAP